MARGKGARASGWLLWIGLAALIVDRDYRRVAAQSDRLLVLQKGQVLLQGRADELRALVDRHHLDPANVLMTLAITSCTRLRACCEFISVRLQVRSA